MSQKSIRSLGSLGRMWLVSLILYLQILVVCLLLNQWLSIPRPVLMANTLWFGIVLLALGYEGGLRLWHYRYARTHRLSHIENTGQHTLIVMAVSLANKFTIPVPDLVVLAGKQGNAVLVPQLQNMTLYIEQELIQALTPEQLKAVIAHEFSHIALGHVPVMSWCNSLLQISYQLPLQIMTSGLNKIAGKIRVNKAVSNVLVYTLIVSLLLGVCGFLLLTVNAISRQFEKHADREAIKYITPTQFITALKALERWVCNKPGDRHAMSAASQTFLPVILPAILSLFDTHPSLQNRIERIRLQQG